MRDKLKGLLLGLLIGTVVSGSIAYAANSKAINVYFRELKFVFDGVEKPAPAGKSPGFIYNNTTYLPIRYIAESLGKEINFDNDTGTVWVGKNYGGDGKKTVVTYTGGTVSQVELDTFIAVSSFYYGQQPAADKKQAASQLVARKLLAAKQQSARGTEAAKAAEEEFARIVQYFGSAEALAGQLKTSKITEWDVRQFIVQTTLVRFALEAMVDDKALQAEYDRRKQADSAAFVTADVRHILVATTDGQTGAALRTEEEALARAKEVRGKLTAGGDFTELAKQYSDDPGSSNAGGLYEDAELTSFVAEFKKAAAELPIGQISEPIKTAYGYHIMKVESRETRTKDQMKNELLQPLLSKAYDAFVNGEASKAIQSTNLP